MGKAPEDWRALSEQLRRLEEEGRQLNLRDTLAVEEYRRKVDALRRKFPPELRRDGKGRDS